MKKIIYIMALLLAFTCLGACGDKVSEDAVTVYYLNRNADGLTGVDTELISSSTTDMLSELTEDLTAQVEAVDYQSPMVGNLEITNYMENDGTLSLYLSEDYSSLDTATAVLVRAALVKTYLQIPKITGVYLFVGDSPLMDADGNVYGLLTEDSFVENPGSQINAASTVSLTLYFADEDGTGLVAEEQEVHYISSVSQEKLVVEQLIAGPESEGLQATIPSDTKVLSVTNTDGVCYVNLDDGFLVQNYSVSEQVVIYSIVDSLFELDSVSKVQISVNGENDLIYRDTISLDQMFTRNLDLIQESGQTLETEVERTGE